MPTIRHALCALLLIALVGCNNAEAPKFTEQQSNDEIAVALSGIGMARAEAARSETWVDGEQYDGVVTPSAVRGDVNELYVSDEGFKDGASQIAAVAPGARG